MFKCLFYVSYTIISHTGIIFIVSLSCFKWTAPFLNQLVSTVIIAFKEPNMTFRKRIHCLFFRALLDISARLPGRLLFFRLYFSSSSLHRSSNQTVCFFRPSKPCGTPSCYVSLRSHSCSPEVKMAASDNRRSDIQVSGWSKCCSDSSPSSLLLFGFFSHVFSFESIVTVWNCRQPS